MLCYNYNGGLVWDPLKQGDEDGQLLRGKHQEDILPSNESAAAYPSISIGTTNCYFTTLDVTSNQNLEERVKLQKPPAACTCRRFSVTSQGPMNGCFFNRLYWLMGIPWGFP